jgi:hypothetical protein
MRTLLLVAATLGVFGTGCGGCVDDDHKRTPAATTTTSPNFSTPRKYQIVAVGPDASIGTATPAPAPAPAADAGK